MELYLLRHAEAGPAPRDEDRQLTDHGLEQANAVAAGIAWLELDLTGILSSPLTRAMQTAQPVASALRRTLTVADTLAPGQSLETVLALTADPGARLLLVGHQPQLGDLVQTITGARVHYRKAMLACLEVAGEDPTHGDLAWLLSWRHLKRLGRG